MYDPDKTVGDLMHQGVISCPKETPIPEVARRITQHDISAIIVVDGDGCLAGLISRTDLAVLYGYDEMWPHLTAEHVMVTQVATVSPDERATLAAKQLHDRKISRLVVTRPAEQEGKQKPVGILSITDIVREMSMA